MRLGIDISQTVFPGGVSFYTKNLVHSLIKTDNKNSYKLFFSSLRQKLPEEFNKYEVSRYPIPPSLINLLWNKLHILPIDLILKNIDVFHASDWTQPPTKKVACVTTIHDLSFLDDPKSTHPKIYNAQTARLKWVKKEVNQIIAVSQSTKEEIIRLLKISENKINVIYEALNPDVKAYINTNQVKIDPKSVGINKPYMFAYGSPSPRKNIDRLLNAFRLFNSSNDYQLVVAGNYSHKPINNVVFTGYLDRKTMLDLFSQSSAFAYPSTYEGFGLPILEAFALNIPVLTSNCSSMKEISDDAALLIDPMSENDIESGIKKIIENESLRNNLIDKGKQRLKNFSWEKCAKETIKVYERAT